MAVPAAAQEQFPQSIQQASRMIRDRISNHRWYLAGQRDAVRHLMNDPAEARRMESLLTALIREAA